MAGVPSLPFAVGVYLPLASSAPIFVGGMVRWIVDRRRNRLGGVRPARSEGGAQRGGGPRRRRAGRLGATSPAARLAGNPHRVQRRRPRRLRQGRHRRGRAPTIPFLRRRRPPTGFPSCPTPPSSPCSSGMAGEKNPGDLHDHAPQSWFKIPKRSTASRKSALSGSAAKFDIAGHRPFCLRQAGRATVAPGGREVRMAGPKTRIDPAPRTMSPAPRAGNLTRSRHRPPRPTPRGFAGRRQLGASGGAGWRRLKKFLRDHAARQRHGVRAGPAPRSRARKPDGPRCSRSAPRCRFLEARGRHARGKPITSTSSRRTGSSG